MSGTTPIISVEAAAEDPVLAALTFSAETTYTRHKEFADAFRDLPHPQTEGEILKLILKYHMVIVRRKQDIRLHSLEPSKAGERKAEDEFNRDAADKFNDILSRLPLPPGAVSRTTPGRNITFQVPSEVSPDGRQKSKSVAQLLQEYQSSLGVGTGGGSTGVIAPATDDDSITALHGIVVQMYSLGVEELNHRVVEAMTSTFNQMKRIVDKYVRCSETYAPLTSNKNGVGECFRNHFFAICSLMMKSSQFSAGVHLSQANLRILQEGLQAFESEFYRLAVSVS